MTTDARPKLPREWYEPRPLATAAFVAFALGMLFIPGLSAVHLMRMDIAWWWKALGVPPLVCLAGHGVHLTGWVGHEGLHCNLHRNKYVSFTVAIAGVVAVRLEMVDAKSGAGAALQLHWLCLALAVGTGFTFLQHLYLLLRTRPVAAELGHST